MDQAVVSTSVKDTGHHLDYKLYLEEQIHSYSLKSVNRLASAKCSGKSHHIWPLPLSLDVQAFINLLLPTDLKAKISFIAS